MFWVLLLYAGFASVFVFAKNTLDSTEPFFLIGSRMLLAGIILTAYLFFTKPEALKLNFNTVKKILLLGICNIYLANAFEFWGLKYLTSFKTCFIYSLSPFASALLSYFFFSEKMGFKKWTGLLVGFSGFIPLFLHHSEQEFQGGTLFSVSWAEISVVMAALTSVYGWIVLKQLVQDRGVSFLAANGLSMIFGGSIALIHSSFTETWSPVPVTDTYTFLTGFTALLVISNLICYNLYGWLLGRFSATFLSFSGFLTPLFTALFGWFFLSEQVDFSFYISAAIVYTGLFVFYQEELVFKTSKAV